MPKPIHGLLDSLIEQFAAAVASRAEQMFARSAAGRAAVRPMGVRLCPNPGCKNPGAGPRNRWFCREHARSVPIREQKRILLERAKANQTAARLARGAREPCRGLVCLGALEQDALLLANRYAARVLAAEPSIAGAGAGILAARVRTQPHAVGASGGTACGGAGEHLFRTGCDCRCELLNETVQQAVDGFRHSFVRARGSNYSRCGSFSSPFGNELLLPRS